MKYIRKIVKEEIKRLTEEKYSIPPEIQNALESKLQMYPLVRYVDYLKAGNTIPPSYRVFVHGGRFFDIFYEDFSLMVKIQGREYYLLDLEERSNAVEHLNRLLMIQPVPSWGDDEEEEEEEPEADSEPADDEPVPEEPEGPAPDEDLPEEPPA